MNFLGFLLVLLICMFCCDGNVVYVDVQTTNLAGTGSSTAPCPSLSCGLKHATVGSTILVAPGVYRGANNTNLCGSTLYTCPQNFTITGSTPTGVIIDGGSNQRGLSISNANALLENLVFQNFVVAVQLTLAEIESDFSLVFTLGGAAILITDNSNVTLKGVAIGSSSALSGGAISIQSSSLNIFDCTFENNRAELFGGAFASQDSNIVINGAKFINNTAVSGIVDGSGGAIYSIISDGNVFGIEFSTFANNSAGASGGAVYVNSISDHTVDIRLQYCNFVSNGVYGSGSCLTSSACNSNGGALYISADFFQIQHSNFTDNVASNSMANVYSQGGAMSVNSRYAVTKISGRLRGIIFKGNFAQSYGGALYVINQHLTISECVFISNGVGSEDNLFSDSSRAGGAIWYSSKGPGNLIEHSHFIGNSALGGWGGALFCSACQSIQLVNDTFSFNLAISSYTFSAQGGAVMISFQSAANISDCVFANNTATTLTTKSPNTFSGSGGALYMVSSSLTMHGAVFSQNRAITGQFDDGANGGAIFLEDVNVGLIERCHFVTNSAEGFLDYSSFASSGSGGAISFKFSSIGIYHSYFFGNWVSVGGTQMSIGGALSIFFNSGSIGTTIVQAMLINNCSFVANIAYAQLCRSASTKSGQGGAIAVIGATAPGIIILNSIFRSNLALATRTGVIPSVGGAIAMSLASMVNITATSFHDNVALYGLGNDIISYSGQSSSNKTNTVSLLSSSFEALLPEALQSAQEHGTNISNALCLVSKQLRADLAAKVATTTTRRLQSAVDEYQTPVRSNLTLSSEARVQMMNDQEAHRLLSGHEILSLNDDWRLANINNDPDFSVEANQSHRKLKQRAKLIKSSILNSPSIVIGSGYAEMLSPKVTGTYDMFVGTLVFFRNVYQASGSSVSEILTQLRTNSQPTYLVVGGEVDQTSLSLTVLESIVQLSRIGGHSIVIKDLRMWNSSLRLLNDVEIAGNASIVNSHLVGLTRTARIHFNNSLHTGLGFTHSAIPSVALAGNSDVDDPEISSELELLAETPLLQIDNAIVLIHRTCRITGDWINFLSRIPRIVIHFGKNGAILISEGAVLEFNSNTLITSASPVAYVLNNSGTISLNPRTNDAQVTLMDLRMGSPIDADVVSSTSSANATLTMEGLLHQSASGTIAVAVSDQLHNTSILNLVNTEQLFGFIKISLSNDSRVLIPAYGGEFASNWTLLQLKTATPVVAEIVSNPSGIRFALSRTKNKQIVYVENVACADIITYYSDADDSNLCFYCSLNSSCTYNGAMGTCADKGTVPNDQAWDTCCSPSCGPSGKCTANEDQEFYCKCANLMIGGETCESLTEAGIGIIFAIVFILTFIGVVVFYTRYYNEQKTEILEELRQNLLTPAALNNTNKKSAVSKQFLESLQQSLILKDVFVNYEEIKVECRIGEGSFGVVFKASFRGAQVALKQMRSPLFEDITQHDIEEFRKEAYMMSRLRHPNIVLVMGISLVDIEPAANRMASMASLDDSNILSGGKKKDGPKTQKTVCIITEYLEQGSLADILYGPTRLPEEVFTYELVLACALQAARGMLYLHCHSPPICHRDLKSSNLVVDDHWVVKVTDFGMSRIIPEKVQNKEMGLDEVDRFSRDGSFDEGRDSTWSEVGMPIQRESTIIPRSTDASENVRASGNRYSSFHPEMTSNLGTTAWCAPELLTAANTTRYSVKVDVYSFGMVMWELWEKRRPFDEFTSRFDITDAIRAGKRPQVSDNCPPAYRSLLQRCWQAEPARRPTFKYIEKYLKDELARVRRQKGTTGRISSIDSGAGLSHRLLSDSSRVSSVADSLGNSSIIPPPKERSTSPVPINNPIVAPEGRSPLLAFERSFSYLARSMDTSSASGSIDSFGQSPTPLPFIIDAQKPILHHEGQHQAQPKGWRDRYVMKFSGWQASNPDVGLPPSNTNSNPLHYSSGSGGVNSRREREVELDIIEEANRESNTTIDSLPTSQRNSLAPSTSGHNVRAMESAIAVVPKLRVENSDHVIGIFPSDLDDNAALASYVGSIRSVQNSGTGAGQLSLASNDVRPAIGLDDDGPNL